MWLMAAPFKTQTGVSMRWSGWTLLVPRCSTKGFTTWAFCSWLSAVADMPSWPISVLAWDTATHNLSMTTSLTTSRPEEHLKPRRILWQHVQLHGTCYISRQVFRDQKMNLELSCTVGVIYHLYAFCYTRMLIQMTSYGESRAIGLIWTRIQGIFAIGGSIWLILVSQAAAR